MSTPTPRASGKTMSSRLTTMKFMQRAAASTPPTTHQLHPQGAEFRPSKRQRTLHIPTTAATPNIDQQLIHAALGEEEKKKEKAIERLAAEAGETKWVLSTVNVGAGKGKQELQTEVAGYSEIDQEAWRPALVGRRSFGKFNLESEKHQNGTTEISSSSSAEMLSTSNENDEDGEDGENSDEAAGTGELLRASKEEALKRRNAQRLERSQQRKAEKAELARLAEKRRKKGVKLNGLVSISGGGGGGSGPTSGRGDKMCYECGEKSHERRACPQKGKRKNQNSPGDQRKRSRPSLEY